MGVMSTAITSLPWEIDAPGHYHLESDLSCQGGEHALRVTAEGVRLDLRGLSLEGDAESLILLEASDFSLINGRLLGEGIALVAAPHVKADRCLFEGIDARGGLFVGGRALTCRGVKVQGGAFGIKGGEESHLSGCEVKECLLGIEAGAGSRLERCTVKSCEEGVYVFGTREMPSHLERVVVYECAALGLRLDGPGVVVHCEAHNNGREEAAGGILAGPASVVSHCEAYGNGGGDIGIVEPCELDHNRTSDGSG